MVAVVGVVSSRIRYHTRAHPWSAFCPWSSLPLENFVIHSAYVPSVSDSIRTGPTRHRPDQPNQPDEPDQPKLKLQQIGQISQTNQTNYAIEKKTLRTALALAVVLW